LGLAVTLAVPVHAKRTCAIRSGQPVIVTRFEVRDPSLTAKLLPDLRSKLENKLSAYLAEQLQCQEGLRFLEWATSASADRQVGTLLVSMATVGQLPRAPVYLVFEAVRKGATEPSPLNFGKPIVLYSVAEEKSPGNVGELFEKRVKTRLDNFVLNQDLLQKLARKFFFVPLIQSEDLLLSETQQVIGLPLGPGRLSAGKGTKVAIDFILKTQEERKAGHTLWVNPCLLRSTQWQSRLQLALVEDAMNVRPSQSSDWSALSSDLASRLPGKTRAFLDSFVWRDPLTCDQYVVPEESP
jgi:hypothetical protein